MQIIGRPANILVSVSEQKDAVGCLNIMPGRIVFEKKYYDMLRDAATPWLSQSYKSLLDPTIPFTYPSLKVKEYSDALKCSFVFLEKHDCNDQDNRASREIGPANLNTMLAYRRGGVSCNKRNCRRVVDDKMIVKTNKQTTEVAFENKKMRIYSGISSETTLAMLASVAYHPRQDLLTLIDAQCVQCCAKALMMDEGVKSGPITAIRCTEFD